jgi:CDP-diacylglycerol--serine O-phosphatidyltransferase
MLIGCYNPSVILTYIGICVSIMGILNAHDLKFAFMCLMIAGVCDMFDGPIARKCKRDDRGKAFGIQIDTLADVTNFVVFPMVLLNAIAHTSPTETGYAIYNVITIVISFLYVLAGIIRLAWFNITTDGHTEYYQGLPVTFISVIMPLIYAISMNSSYLKEIILGTMLTVAVLFVANIKIKKPRGKALLIFLVMGVLITVLLYRSMILGL